MEPTPNATAVGHVLRVSGRGALPGSAFTTDYGTEEPMKRIAVTTMFALGVLVGGVGVAHAEGSCTMRIANGQVAPCPPPVISTGPGDESLGPATTGPTSTGPKAEYIYEEPYWNPYVPYDPYVPYVPFIPE